MLESVIYSCDGKAEFSASLLRSFVSHDPSEVILIYWFSAQETLLILKTVVVVNIFVETCRKPKNSICLNYNFI